MKTHGHEIPFDRIGALAESVREQVGQIIVGQDPMIDHLLVALFCQGHCLVIGVPGLAKTLAVRCLGRCLGLPFARIQFTPDMMPADVIGTELIQDDASTGQRSLLFSRGPVFTHLLLADEINRTPPRTQAALLEAMAERQVTAGGQTMALSPPFIVIATQNPIEQEGTYPLPEAQLDRFMFSLQVQYPQADDELQIISRRLPDALGLGMDQEHGSTEPVTDIDELNRITRTIAYMPVSEPVAGYATELVRATRPGETSADEWVSQYVAWGAGPRAGMYLLLAARAQAAIAGRPSPSIADIRTIAHAVLGHRILLNYNATADGVEVAQIIDRLLSAGGD